MNKNKTSYDKISEEWSQYRHKSVINKCIADFAKNFSSGAKVLDVGCGSGEPIAKFLSEKSIAVTGIDISSKMIEKANGLGLKNAKFLVADIATFKTKETFDAIIAFDSIFHINKNEWKKVIKKLATLTRPGGQILFTSGKEKGEVVGDMFGEPFYYSSLSTNELLKLLAINNFTVVQATENYTEKSTGERDLLVVAQKN